MVTTVKFSEFDNAALDDNDLSSVGLENGVNIKTPKYPTWTTAGRPATPFTPLLGYNTTIESYEFWDGTQWTQLEDSTDIAVLLALLASHLPGEGASLIGLEGTGTVQDLAEVPFIVKVANAAAPNAQSLGALASGFLTSTTATGVVASRLLIATANQVDISNTDGSGNPAFSLSATLNFPGTFTVQGSTVIDEIIDDDTMATATDSNIPTAESVVAYIASVVGGAAGGVPGNIQYNDAGGFGGDANFNTDGAGNIDIVGSLDVDNININGNTISSTDVNGNVIINPNGTGSIDLSSDIVLIGQAIQHSGDTNNQIIFGADTQDFQTGGASRLDISDTGVRMGGANSRVTTILDEDNMVSDSPTALATQQSIKAYVDAIAAAFNTVFSARLASTVALTVTYNNGASGVGATLTNAGVQAALTLDGVAAVVGDLVLIKNQASTLQNGYYVVTDIGSGATNWVLTRSTKYDAPAEIEPGDLFVITAGSTQANTSWIQTATVTAVGVDAITFTQYSVALPIPISQGGTGATNAADARTNLGLGTMAVQNANAVAITGGTIVGLTNLEVDNIQIDGDSIIHIADTNNKIVFGTDTQDFQTGGSSRLDISDTGVRMGAANSRVTTILDEDTMASDSATALATQQSIKAYVDSKVGASVGLLSNMLFNSTFVIAQRGSNFTAAGTYPNNDAVYLIDGWVNLSDGNDVVDIQQNLTGIPTAWGGNRYQCLIATANKQFGAVQFVESLTPQSPIFQTSTFTAMIAVDLPAATVTLDNIRFAIIEWTGAVNAVTRDPISAWASGATLPTLAANWAYVANHAEITVDSTTKFYKITGTTSASANNIAFIWWCSDANATLNDQLGIRGCWLFTGDVTASLPADGTSVGTLADNFLPTVTVGLELRTAQRYFQKTFPQTTAPASNTGDDAGAISYTVYRAGAVNNFIRRDFPVVMRAAPTIASFSPGSAGTTWYNENTTANSGAYSTQNISDASLVGFNPGVAGDALSHLVGIHATMSAEL